MNRNKAFTLVEMLMTMTMGSSLMLLAIGLVHQSLSLSKLGKSRGEHDSTVNRFAQQFRSDVHSAKTLLAVSPTSLQLTMPDSTTISYQVVESSVRREQTSVDGPQANDRFYFEPLCSIQFQPIVDSQLVQFQLERRFKNEELPARIDLQVIAQTARWLELQQPTPKTSAASRKEP